MWSLSQGGHLVRAQLTLVRDTGMVTLLSHRLSTLEEPLIASCDMGHKSPNRAWLIAATQKWYFPFLLL